MGHFISSLQYVTIKIIYFYRFYCFTVSVLLSNAGYRYRSVNTYYLFKKIRGIRVPTFL